MSPQNNDRAAFVKAALQELKIRFNLGISDFSEYEWISAYEESTDVTDFILDIESTYQLDDIQVPQWVENINWELLSNQKQSLFKMIDHFATYHEDYPNEEIAYDQLSEHAEGLVNLLDGLQDWASEELGLFPHIEQDEFYVLCTSLDTMRKYKTEGLSAFQPCPEIDHYIGTWYNEKAFFDWFCESEEAQWMETYFKITKEQHDEIQNLG